MMKIISILILPLLISGVLLYSFKAKVSAYDCFIEGAKDGLKVAVNIIPYIVAIMVAVGMLRASGFFDMLSHVLARPLDFLKIPADVIPLLFTRSFSGGASLGIFSDIANANGGNSYAAKLAAVIMGSSETTFYVLAVYFGSIGIKRYRHAVLTGIIADFAGIVFAVLICRYLFL